MSQTTDPEPCAYGQEPEHDHDACKDSEAWKAWNLRHGGTENEDLIRGLNGATMALYMSDEPVPEDHLDIVVNGGGHTAGIVLPPAQIAALAGQLADALREAHTRAGHLGARSSWVSSSRVWRPVRCGHFLWSLRIDADGSSDTSEAKVSPFETGIDC